jgi:ribosomal protein S4
METKDPQVKKESDQLLLHLTRIGVLPAASSLDDVLALETESVLSRRLQTLVYLKGLSTTPDHSRQLINHGHIAINKRKVTIPGYMVTKDEENEIGYTGISPLNEMSHPARPKTDVYKTGITPTEEKKTEEPKEPIKPKEKPDIKEEKTVVKKETKDTKEDAAEPAKKSEEETENKSVKEEKTEEPKEPVKPKEKPDIKEEKTVVKEETTTPVKQSEDDKKDKPSEDKKPELPSETKEESAEEKTETVEKPETKNKKSNEKEGGN